MTNQLARGAVHETLNYRVVEIEVRSVFGTVKCYPMNAAARTFAQIAGSTTLTRATLCMIESLGYEIVSMANADWRSAGR